MPISRPPVSEPQRFVGGFIGLIFACIGLIVIGFLWADNGFIEPPLFFKLVGTLVALAFVATGGSIFMTSCQSPRSGRDISDSSAIPEGVGYTCPACGARLGEEADVSPKGDVKCSYCRKWFNIHG